LRLFVLLVLLVAALSMVPAPKSRAAESSFAAAVKILPGRIKDFVADGAARPSKGLQSGDFNETGEATREYRPATGERLSITVVTTNSESSAYAFLTSCVSRYQEDAVAAGRDARILQGEAIGTASYRFADALFFYKGPVYVVVGQMARGKNPEQVVVLAHAFADLLDKGEGELPALVKHLPDWPRAQQGLRYAVHATTLARIIPGQPVIETIGFEGGAEAVAANYGSSQLVIVEFNTPQLASDNDRRIIAKIQELRTQGQSVPTAYRRVGNYSVFVFNAPDEQTANRLIDQVKYEQVVQWLPGKTISLAAREREYVETTLGVFVSVVKASGLAIVLCLGLGGFVGTLLFRRRRARQSAMEAYSDAGGMLRLNIDELTAQTDPSKLIGPGS
jgi:hypothetical protein